MKLLGHKQTEGGPYGTAAVLLRGPGAPIHSVPRVNEAWEKAQSLSSLKVLTTA